MIDFSSIIKILRVFILGFFLFIGFILIIQTKSNKKVIKKKEIENDSDEKIKKEPETNYVPDKKTLEFFSNVKKSVNESKINTRYVKNEKELKKDILNVYITYFKIKEDYIEQDDKDIIKKIEKPVIMDSMYFINHKDITDDESLYSFIEYKMVDQLEKEYKIEFKKIPQSKRRKELLEKKNQKEEQIEEVKKEEEKEYKKDIKVNNEVETEVIDVENSWAIEDDKLITEDKKLFKLIASLDDDIETKIKREENIELAFEERLDVIEKYIEKIEKEYNKEEIITIDDIEEKINDVKIDKNEIVLDEIPIQDFEEESIEIEEEKVEIEKLPEKLGTVSNEVIKKVKTEEEKKPEVKKETKKVEEKKYDKISFAKIETELQLLKAATKQEMEKDELEDKNYEKIEDRIAAVLMKVRELKSKNLSPKDREKIDKYEKKLINMKNQIDDQKQAEFLNEENDLNESFSNDQIEIIEEEVYNLEKKHHKDLNSVGLRKVEDLDNLDFRDAKRIEQHLINKNLKRANRNVKIANMLTKPFLRNRFFCRLASGLLVYKSLNYIENILKHKTKEIDFDISSIKNGHDALNGAINMNSKNILYLNELEREAYLKHPELEKSFEFTVRINSLKKSLIKREERLIKKENFIKKNHLLTKVRKLVLTKKKIKAN